MRIAICDDEKETALGLKAIIENVSQSLDTVTDVYTEADVLLKSFREKKYDIVFLDIEMPKTDGLTAAARIREMSEEVNIVFLTSHVEYAVKGYEVNALRYLTKPAEPDNVRDIIEHIINKQNSEKALWVKTNEGEFRVRLSDIIYIEAQDQKVIIYTASDNYEVWGKLSDYDDKLSGEGFFRIHRSFLVSLSKVSGISGKYITVTNGDELPVGRTKEKEFRKAMVTFVDKEAF